MPYNTSGSNLAHNNAAQQAGRNDRSVNRAGGGNSGNDGGNQGGTQKGYNPGQMTLGGPTRTNAVPGSAYDATKQRLINGGYAANDVNAENAIRSQGNFVKAVNDYNQPGLGGFLKRNIGIMGIGLEQPHLDQPATYAGGSPQIGLNPGNLLGSMAGFAVPGLGFATGPIGGALYNATGAKDLTLSGDGGIDPQSGLPHNSGFGTGTPQNHVGNASSGGLPAFSQPQAPGGAAFGAQPAAQSPMGAFFTPNLANHTVPQGYQSAFPNSLSAQDKQLLYANALGAMG